MQSNVAFVRTAAQLAQRACARRSLSYVQSQASYDSVFARFAQHRACAVLRTQTKEAAPKAMTAAIEIVEFTMTTPGCLDTLADFRKKYDGQVMVGCGTVMTTIEAEQAMDAGAQFMISPILIPEVITWCVSRNVVCIPGCQTPTELYEAYKLGAPIQKVFPGVSGAMAWVRSVSAALPMLKMNPTSGVDLDNAGDYLKNGAFGVGLVAPLFPPDVIAAENWDQIHANAVKVIQATTEAGPVRRADIVTPPQSVMSAQYKY